MNPAFTNLAVSIGAMQSKSLDMNARAVFMLACALPQGIAASAHDSS